MTGFWRNTNANGDEKVQQATDEWIVGESAPLKHVEQRRKPWTSNLHNIHSDILESSTLFGKVTMQRFNTDITNLLQGICFLQQSGECFCSLVDFKTRVCHCILE